MPFPMPLPTHIMHKALGGVALVLALIAGLMLAGGGVGSLAPNQPSPVRPGPKPPIPAPEPGPAPASQQEAEAALKKPLVGVTYPSHSFQLVTNKGLTAATFPLRMQATDGCNQTSAPARVAPGGVLVLSHPRITTKKACIGRNAEISAFHRVVENGARISVLPNGNVVFTRGGGSLTFQQK